MFIAKALGIVVLFVFALILACILFMVLSAFQGRTKLYPMPVVPTEIADLPRMAESTCPGEGDPMPDPISVWEKPGVKAQRTYGTT